jgi:uncharacterized protein
MVGTYVGARLAVYFSGAAQLALFAVVMLLAAFFMFREKKPLRTDEEEWLAETADEEAMQDAAVLPGGAPVGRMPLGLIVIEGLAVGVLTGLVGVGGGFLIVPALVLLGKIPMKQAVGTSLLVIAMKSATGFLGYLGQVEVPWSFMTLFTAIAVVGILGGTYLVRYVSQAALKRAFAVFLVVMGGFILYQNRAVLLPHRTAEASPSSDADATGRAFPSEGSRTRASLRIPALAGEAIDYLTHNPR